VTDHLAIYLNDHLMGSTGGLELFRRVAGNIPEVAPIIPEIVEERDHLKALLAAVGGTVDPVKVTAGWAGEKLSRLKLNGGLIRRSPLSDLIELESLVITVSGKRCLWRMLIALDDPRLSRLDEMLAMAESQLERLEELRLQRGPKVLTS